MVGAVKFSVWGISQVNSCEIGVFGLFAVKAGMSEDALSSGWAALSVQGFIVQFVNIKYIFIFY